MAITPRLLMDSGYSMSGSANIRSTETAGCTLTPASGVIFTRSPKDGHHVMYSITFAQTEEGWKAGAWFRRKNGSTFYTECNPREPDYPTLTSVEWFFKAVYAQLGCIPFIPPLTEIPIRKPPAS